MNINFNENNDKRTDEHGTFVDKPVRPRLSDLDFVTWADMIDWGEFNLRLNSLTPNAQVTNSYESFINALKVNFDFLYQKIVELGGGDSTPSVIAVTSVTLNSTSFTLSSINSTKQLTASINPSNATNTNVTWSSDNTSVATVSNSGLVTPVGIGTANITCTTEDGNKTATAICRCSWSSNVPVTGVSVSPTSATIQVGSGRQLGETVSPANATNKNVTWSSSNTSVATVDGDGYVRGVSQGSATITVRTEDGGKTATCSISVENSSTQSNNYFLGETAQEAFTTSDLTSYQATKPTNLTVNRSTGDVVTVWIYPASWGEPSAMMNNGDNDKAAWTWGDSWLQVPNGYVGAWTQAGGTVSFDLTW